MTLAAIGGSGKTRLALEVAHRVHDRFADGAAFVDLVPVRDPALIADAVATAIGMPLGSTSVSADDLGRFLTNRSLLLILDNCEHLLEGCASLAETLRHGCGSVAMLATSREALGVDGERIVNVPPLDLDESLELFAARSESGTRMDDEVVRDICDHLDGMPLAVELAAAQTRHLPLHEIRALLDDRLGLRGRAARNDDRHRTLEAMMDWSYRLLDADDQCLLRRLSVFAGSFTLDAVAAVCGEPDARRSVIANRLGALVDKSLVVADPASGRLSLLETVRFYAARRLEDATEHDATHTRLVEWLIRRAPGPWWWAKTREVDDVALELDNVRAALDGCAAAGKRHLTVRLAAAFGVVWYLATRGAEALRWLAVDRELDEQLELDDRLAWRAASAWCRLTMIDGVGAYALAEEGLALAPLGHPAVPVLQCAEGWILNYVDPARASASFAAVRASTLHTEMWRANADYLEGNGCLITRRFEDALTVLRRAAASELCIHPTFPWIDSAIALQFLGRHDEAVAALDRAKRSLGDIHWYFLELTLPFTELLLAAGEKDVATMIEHFDAIVARTRDFYPHVESAWGFALQAGVIVGAVAEEPELAVTLYSAARELGAHRRWEGANISGRMYGRAVIDRLESEVAAAASQRGRKMSLADAVELAEAIADRARSRLPTTAKRTTPEASPVAIASSPAGTVTLMFSDMEGFTEMTERLGDAAALEVVRAHNKIVRDRLKAYGGEELDLQGDGFLLAFSKAGSALECAVAIQRALREYSADHPEQPVRVRMGIHTGEPIREERGFFGKSVILAARIAAQARGGEILVSSVVKELCEHLRDVRFDEGRSVELKGISAKRTVFRVLWQASGEPPAPSLPASEGATSSPEGVFRREGAYWKIVFRGESLRLKDTIGLRYLAELLRRPRERLHLTELAACVATPVDDASASEQRSSELSPGRGDAGEVLDARAKAAYRERLRELREYFAEAEANGNQRAAAEIGEEIESLTAELSRAVGLGGRERRAGSDVERLRFSVTKAIKGAIQKIADALPSLGHHLATTVRTGAFCSYTPDPAHPPSWDV